MKARLFVGFLVVSILSTATIGVLYGTEFMKAISIEVQRYGGINPRYASVGVGAILASYFFGYVSTRSKLV